MSDMSNPDDWAKRGKQLLELREANRLLHGELAEVLEQLSALRELLTLIRDDLRMRSEDGVVMSHKQVFVN